MGLQMQAGFTRLNIQLSKPPATIKEFKKIHKSIYNAAMMSHADDDEIEIAFHEKECIFSITVEYSVNSHLSMVTAGWILGGVQARFEEYGVVREATFWVSTHDSQDRKIESPI
jgi:hypothetical protein